MGKRLRSLRDSLAKRLTPRRLLMLGGSAAIVAVLILNGAPKPATAPDNRPVIEYVGTWTLADLERHLEAGEVVAITTGIGATAPTVVRGAVGPTATMAAPIMAARTISGQMIKIDTATTTAGALAALRSLGYGRLFSTEAVIDVTGTRVPPGEPLSPAITLLYVVLFVGVLIYGIHRLAGRAAKGSGSSSDGRFTTTRPVAAVDSGVDGLSPSTPTARRTSPPRPVTFDDIAGYEEAKQELTEVIDFLKNPERFTRLGANIPRGLLLYGPPGCGKTTFGKAVAAQAGVAFTYASGSEFVEKYVGVGAGRVRDLFKQARAAGQGVIFIDELDALGRHRGGRENGNGEADQTLNQLLVEMDGFGTTDDIIIIGATNRLDTLDSALLRPGRFTRRINIPMPDEEARRAILAVHAKYKPLASDVDLDEIAEHTAEFSGAMLADLLNEAAILAARRGGDDISAGDVDEGLWKVGVGLGVRRSMPDRERSIIAAHETGHAVCGHVAGSNMTIGRISLHRHGDALGVTKYNVKDNLLPAESHLRAMLIGLMGGRAAEALLFTEITGGASNDFEKANEIATAMVQTYGMGVDPDSDDLGVTGRGSLGWHARRHQSPFSTDVDAAMSRAAKRILDEAYEEAVAILVEHRDALNRVAAHLFVAEEISGDTFLRVFRGELLPPFEKLDAWRVPAAKPRPWTEVAHGLGRAARAPFRDSDRTARGQVAPTDPSLARRADDRRASIPPRLHRPRRGLIGALLTAAGDRLHRAASRREARGRSEQSRS